MKNPRLQELKDEYMNIPIPDELEFTVQKALKEGSRKAIKRSNRIRLASASAAAIILFTLSLNISPIFAQTLADVPIIKNIVDVLTFREFQVKEDTFDADIKVPAVTGLKNKSLEDSLNNRYLEENKKLYQEFIKDMEDLKANGGGHMGVASGYEIKTDNDRILSISRWVVNTAASSSTTVKYDTIDKEKEILITLPSLFKDDSYAKTISEHIQNQMREQMQADPDKIYWVSGTGQELMFDPFEEISREQSFYINNDNKLVISFDKYEVAPGYMGVVEFIIPTEVISSNLVSNEYIK